MSNLISRDTKQLITRFVDSDLVQLSLRHGIWFMMFSWRSSARTVLTRQDVVNPRSIPAWHRCRLFSLRPPLRSLRDTTSSSGRRPFSTSPSRTSVHDILSSVPSVLVPPVVFVGLGLTLWTYKCLMMVVFQNKIIYMPSMPPFSRSERIEDYEIMCKPVNWEERRVRAGDGTDIALCVGNIPCGQGQPLGTTTQKLKRVVVLYFQGNGSSTPPRLPLLSNVLKKLSERKDTNAVYTMVAVSYRGYWTSRGRPSQRGIEMDAIAAVRWVQDTYCADHEDTSVVLWGQSIGAGVATGLLAHHSREINTNKTNNIHGLILETPFLSIKSMLLAMYPQRWLPYRYLWPFLRNWWDSEDALRRVGRHIDKASSAGIKSLPILIVSAANDELVPSGQAEILEQLCHDVGLPNVTRHEISGALHNDATAKGAGQNAVVRCLTRMGPGTK